MSQVDAVEQFTSHGREFTVLHKDSASYLRADGRMVAELGGGLSISQAIAFGRLQAEVFQVNERAQEVLLLHRLYEIPLPIEMKAIAIEYALLKVAGGDCVYAAFNHNAYVYTAQGWQFLGVYESAEQLQFCLPQELAGRGLRPAPFLLRPLAAGGFRRNLKLLAYTLSGLGVALGFGWALQALIGRWPISLPLAMGAIFLGCAVALYQSRKDRKRAQK
jgi:hypothetical protein